MGPNQIAWSLLANPDYFAKEANLGALLGGLKQRISSIPRQYLLPGVIGLGGMGLGLAGNAMMGGAEQAIQKQRSRPPVTMQQIESKLNPKPDLQRDKPLANTPEDYGVSGQRK